MSVAFWQSKRYQRVHLGIEFSCFQRRFERVEGGQTDTEKKQFGEVVNGTHTRTAFWGCWYLSLWWPFLQGVRPEALDKVEISEIRDIIQRCIMTKKDERQVTLTSWLFARGYEAVLCRVIHFESVCTTVDGSDTNSLVSWVTDYFECVNGRDPTVLLCWQGILVDFRPFYGISILCLNHCWQRFDFTAFGLPLKKF